MNILFYAGEAAVSYACPQLGVAIKGARYLKTAYNVVKATSSIMSGDVVSGGVSLASMAVTQLAGTSIGPGIPGGGGISSEYLKCINDCYKSCGETWTLALCMAGCETLK